MSVAQKEILGPKMAQQSGLLGLVPRVNQTVKDTHLLAGDGPFFEKNTRSKRLVGRILSPITLAKILKMINY
jgi:hypothetical protein